MGQLNSAYSQPQLLGPEVTTCSWFKEKNNEKKKVLCLQFQPGSPLAEPEPFIHWALKAVGGDRTDGPPPRGSLIRKLNPKGK